MSLYFAIFIDIEEEKRKYKTKTAAIVHKMVDDHEEYAKALIESMEQSHTYELARHRVLIHNKCCAEFDVEISQCQDDIDRDKVSYLSCKL